LFAECKTKNTQQRPSLLSAKKTLGKELLYRVQKKNTWQRTFLPSVFFTECFFGTRQITSLPSARKLHSANHLALGKEPVSGWHMSEHLM
jgi:hypothetical protein